ncbi:hypothetical protein BJY00DRAFT_320727 [Aspergillus carlsbadensis]|nr:hypothetical protein BJY00DRAFT_320727 [Aspergillus carlsbadensis]
MGYPWSALDEWQPFKVDALGLVTLLGAQEIDHAIGRLVPSRWLEYMPLLAGHVIAGDQFRQKKPAFNWYNVTSGIHTTDLAAWFSRWLMAQDFTPTRTIVWWEVRDQRRRRQGHQWGQRLDDKGIAALMSLCTTGVLIAMGVLLGDWYGFANGVALALSILVRAYIVRANGAAIDAAVERTLEGRVQDDSGHVKTLMILPDSTAITVFVSETLIRTVFVCNPTPHSAMMYGLARAIGWVTFGVHIVALGMAQLVSQLCTVTLLIVSTVLVCYRVGCDDFLGIWKRTNATLQPSKFYTCWIGTYLRVTVLEWPTDADFAKDENGNVRRQDLYAWLNLDAAEEESLAKWNLLPHARGYSTWVDDFNAKKALISRDPIDIRRLVMRKREERGVQQPSSGAKVWSIQ